MRIMATLFHIEPVAEFGTMTNRPLGFFAIEADDPMVGVANSAPASLAPPRLRR
jgi:hypothetical protein